MRLARVQVTKLFGLFDHEIRLNLDERMTIIHGPNGFGKTVVLKMMEALISGEYALFREVPFATFTVEADSDLSMTVVRKEHSDQSDAKQQRPIIQVKLTEAGEKPRYWLRLERRKHTEPVIIPLHTPDTADGALESNHDEPGWLAEARDHLPKVRLIRTQRLDLFQFDEDRGEDDLKPTVQVYSEDLSARIRQKLAEYATRSQEFDRTFPARLLRRVKAEPLSAESLREKLAKLEQKRSALTHLGFLKPEQELDLNDPSVEAIEAKRDVLTVYVEDMENKLSIFDEMASKVELFTRIINERFLHKKLAIHSQQGFVFTSATGARLRPADLSSGEQHEIILFYELLFQLRKDELILIDEPEISLHVAWQEKFLEDLSEVVKLSEIDVVIATHSPEIIGDHWDLTVELKGPAELRKG